MTRAQETHEAQTSVFHDHAEDQEDEVERGQENAGGDIVDQKQTTGDKKRRTDETLHLRTKKKYSCNTPRYNEFIS